jgi:YspA, cpYpsA-related SLOG family
MIFQPVIYLNWNYQLGVSVTNSNDWQVGIPPNCAWLICGDRNFDDWAKFIYETTKHLDHDDLIISGGARGADTLAERYAEVFDLSFKLFPANWDKYGRAAGPIRNREMLKELLTYKNQGVIAFLAEGSKGTANMIKQARDAGVENIIIVRV